MGNIANPPRSLADALPRYGSAYLLTTTAGGAPHAIAVACRLDGGAVVVEGAGKRSRANLAERPKVALLWPPPEESGYSLIVDGSATVSGQSLRIQPTRAVLTRSASAPAPASPGVCGSDCVELEFRPTAAPTPAVAPT